MAITRTTNIGLQKPATGDKNWGTTINANLDALDAFAAIGGLAVRPVEYPSASLNVKVAAGSYRKADGSAGTYAGTASQAIPLSSTQALWLTDAGVLTLGAAFPTTPHIRLATVTTDATTVTAVVDGRIQCGVVGI